MSPFWTKIKNGSVGVGVGVLVGVLVGVGVWVLVGVFVGGFVGVGVLVGVVVGVGVFIGVFDGVILGVGVGVGVCVKKGKICSNNSLSVGAETLYLNVGEKTFCPMVGWPSTINLDPFAILPDLFLKSKPIVI